MMMLVIRSNKRRNAFKEDFYFYLFQQIETIKFLFSVRFKFIFTIGSNKLHPNVYVLIYLNVELEWNMSLVTVSHNELDFKTQLFILIVSHLKHAQTTTNHFNVDVSLENLQCCKCN